MPDTTDRLALAGREASEAVPQAKRRSRAGLLVAAALVALLGAGIYGGMRNRASAEATLAARTSEAAVPVVTAVMISF